MNARDKVMVMRFSPAEWNRLASVARQQEREPEQQARWWVRQALSESVTTMGQPADSGA